jgi:LuxR family maltose regulon positive regulatory protein
MPNADATLAPAVDHTLLLTKLYMPQVPAETVLRPRLFERLNQGLDAPLILIAAPAGFGKTTIVMHWLHDHSVPVAWLSLDATDNDPATFIR